MGIHRLEVGDQLVVGGGYDMNPGWLAVSEAGYQGRVVEFIPGQNATRAAVIELHEELVHPDGAGAVRGVEVRGDFLVLELGHSGADWSTPTPRVHVELCDFRPEAKRRQDRRQGAWVESHATYWLVEQPERR
jgi:hypothetical protein